MAKVNKPFEIIKCFKMKDALCHCIYSAILCEYMYISSCSTELTFGLAAFVVERSLFI